MAFPTTPLLDDFNRPDSTNLGSNWTETSDCQIVSQTFRAVTLSGMSYWNVAKYTNLEVYATVAVTFAADTIFLEWRQALASNRNSDTTTDANWSGYYLEANPGTRELKVYRYDGATSTQIGSTVTLAGLSVGDKLGVSMPGDTIALYWSQGGGAWQRVGTDIVDSTFPTAGRIALAVQSTSVAWGNFGGGEILSAPGGLVAAHGMGMGRW